jgi:hypothetical protein
MLRHQTIILFTALAIVSCSTRQTLNSRPTVDDIHTLNESAKDRWVSVTTTDNSVFDGNHLIVTDSTVQLLTEGSEFAETDGDADVTIPIDAIRSISVHHLSVLKPFLYPVLGAVAGAALCAGSGNDGGEGILICSIVGGGLGTLYAAFQLIGYVIPDLFTDRPTFYLQYPRENLPIVIVDSSAH